MKRSTAYPERRSEAETKLNSQKSYSNIEKHPGKINPIFLKVPDYGIKKGAVK